MVTQKNDSSSKSALRRFCDDLADLHADDANLISSERNLMIKKVRAMLDYCRVKSIVLQPSKCYFTVINGSPDDKQFLQIEDHNSIEYR